MSGNLLYCIISSYMLYFFTNVFGLSVGVAGVLLLIGRIFDASHAVQSASSLTGIHLSFIWVPIIIYIISLILMVTYRKWERHEPVVQKELVEREVEAEEA